MARIRYIKPEFFFDEDLAQLPPLYRLAFAGLWCQADREGRLKDRPNALKVHIVPFDDIDFELVLSELSKPKPIHNSCAFITRYEVNGEKYIQINKFTEHQRPHHSEQSTCIPAMNTVKTRCMKRVLPLYTPMETEKGTETETDKGAQVDFDKLWKEYPNKKNKQMSEKYFFKLNPDSDLVEKIFSFIQSARKSIEWTKDNGQYVPMFSTFLNNKRWEDELTFPVTAEPKEKVPDVLDKIKAWKKEHGE